MNRLNCVWRLQVASGRNCFRLVCLEIIRKHSKKKSVVPAELFKTKNAGQIHRNRAWTPSNLNHHVSHTSVMGGNGHPEILFYGQPITELQVTPDFLGLSHFMGKLTCLALSALCWPLLGMWLCTCTERSHHEQLWSLGYCTKGPSRSQ